MIKVEKLNKIYKNGKLELHALFDIDFNVKQGEFVSIMGASGSGKSTFLQILGCLDHATTGTYILDGVNVSEANDKDFSNA